jgi:REP element-mobilizing transposase RayT
MGQQPLVIAYHLIWTAYGWWLPNDPRGSGSRTVRTDILAALGELHYGRKRVQPVGRDVRLFYDEAADKLTHPLLILDETARGKVASEFAEVIDAQQYTCYACAIMPDHIHILIRNHKHQAEEMMEALKSFSRSRLLAGGHRASDHPTWAGGGGWKVFLDHPDEVRRTIDYIDKNPRALGWPRQGWEFVNPYDGWPLHPGHSPHSPYVRRLREAGRR